MSDKDDKDKILLFTRYEMLSEPKPIEVETGAQVEYDEWGAVRGVRPGQKWLLDPKPLASDVVGDMLRERLLEEAMRPSPFGDFKYPPVPWWTRLWWRVEKWLPRVHLGPCNHEECGW